MGLFGKLFGGAPEHPPLTPGSPEAARLERYRDVLTSFAGKLHGRLEVVPGEKVAYCFIGDPPEAFGIAWFEGGDEHNLKTLMKAKGLSQGRVARLSDELRAAYIACRTQPRYEVQLGKKKVVVTPSATLERELVRIIHEAEE